MSEHDRDLLVGLARALLDAACTVHDIDTGPGLYGLTLTGDGLTLTTDALPPGGGELPTPNAPSSWAVH
jgi:hypothetical protein